MADTTTTNYSLIKPEIGASEDTWGQKVNDNFDSIDSQMKANADAIASNDTDITALQTNKANLASPALTGTPTAPTVTPNTDNTTKLATTAFVQSALSNVDLTTKASLNGDAAQNFSANNFNGTSLVLGSFTIYDSGTYLYVKYGSNNIARLDSSGNLVVEGNITAYQGV